MLTFEQTHDTNLVERTLTNPRCYSRMANDSAPQPEEFAFLMAGCTVVLARVSREPAALFFLWDEGDGKSAHVHFCFVPEFWGRPYTVYVAREFLRWVWRNTGHQRLVGRVPSYNRLALSLAIESGFTRCGESEVQGTKNGQPFHWIITEALKC
jgi:RimJ/RimL family protein N-acetyltransferase